jgi:histone-lysine N-methyltransferase SETMAR
MVFFSMTKKLSANPCIGMVPGHQGKKKARKNESNFKTMAIVFLGIRGIVHIDWVLEGETLNQVYYKEVLTVLHEWVRRKRPEVWKNGSWILHHDNVPADNALSVKTFLAKHKISVMEYPPYSPDLAPCDFFLFPEIKSALKGTCFKSIDAVKVKGMEVMKKLSERDLQHCFQQWEICMEWCRGRGGDHFEGDNISIV